MIKMNMMSDDEENRECGECKHFTRCSEGQVGKEACLYFEKG